MTESIDCRADIRDSFLAICTTQEPLYYAGCGWRMYAAWFRNEKPLNIEQLKTQLILTEASLHFSLHFPSPTCSWSSAQVHFPHPNQEASLILILVTTKHICTKYPSLKELKYANPSNKSFFSVASQQHWVWNSEALVGVVYEESTWLTKTYFEKK